MEENIKTIKPLAYIETDFKDKFGIPRQSGRVKALFGKIIFEPEFSDPDFIRNIEEFSHLWLIFGFSSSKGYGATVRPPRLGGNRRIGVFASRSPFRPNGLGLSCVKLEKILNEKGKTGLVVSGIDLLSGTPIYDIKPYVPYADIIPDAIGGYAEKNKTHRLKVNFPEKFKQLIPKEKQEAAVECLADDPRPSYQNDSERIYIMSFAGFEISFKTDGKSLEVINVNKERQNL